jgi:hypothetical protein
MASSYEPPHQYQAVDSLAAAVAQGGANQFRIFTSKEKRTDEWKYRVILAAREWFYQHKSSDEAYIIIYNINIYNKQQMGTNHQRG